MVTAAHRSASWIAIGSAKAAAEPSGHTYLHYVVQISQSAPSHVANIIDKDIPRTPIAVSPAALRRVLLSYAVRNPKVGYVQGMSGVGAYLLTHCDEPCAFWLLAYMVEDQLPPHFYSADLVGARAELAVVRASVAYQLPELHDHLAKTALGHIVDHALLIPCLVGLFIGLLPSHLLDHVWDELLVPGTGALVHASVALMRALEPSLCNATTIEEIHQLLETRNNSGAGRSLSIADAGASCSITGRSVSSAVHFTLAFATSFQAYREGSCPSTEA